MSELVHIYQWYEADGDTMRRMKAARDTWPAWYDQDREMVRPWVYRLRNDDRTSLSIGAKKRCPFVKHVFDKALLFNPNMHLFVYGNSDIHVVLDASHYIRRSLSKYGCGYSKRVDFKPGWVPEHPITMADLGAHIEATWYQGADLFWFTRDWWEATREDFPDAVLGYEGWDFCMKQSMHESGFPEAVDWLIYHEEHDNHWKATLETLPGQLYCRKLCREWAERHGYQDRIHEKGFLFT